MNLLNENVIHYCFWGSVAQNEKMIARFFSSSVPLRLLLFLNVQILICFWFPHIIVVFLIIWVSCCSFFLWPWRRKGKKFVLFIKKPQNPNNQKTNPKDPKNPVWWPELLSLFCDNYHRYFLVYCIGQFVYFFWLCKGIWVLYSTIVIKPDPKCCLTHL